MANADEMFEALGYEKVKEPVFEDWITYSQGFLSAEVTFDTMFQNVYVNSTINAKLHNEIYSSENEWSPLDIALIKCGWAFRTEAEAEANKERVLTEMREVIKE